MLLSFFKMEKGLCLWYTTIYRDGRYEFKYIDATGKQQFVYSWKLEKTDKTPQGKRDDIS
ncbi:MAG: integrase DNA-binding domain-containing protein [Lachnospiraceae bacterium]|nr:integrase DNA-binding domain-containing protein [Lachnospiraceae bacterium]